MYFKKLLNTKFLSASPSLVQKFQALELGDDCGAERGKHLQGELEERGGQRRGDNFNNFFQRVARRHADRARRSHDVTGGPLPGGEEARHVHVQELRQLAQLLPVPHAPPSGRVSAERAAMRLLSNLFDK